MFNFFRGLKRVVKKKENTEDKSNAENVREKIVPKRKIRLEPSVLDLTTQILEQPVETELLTLNINKEYEAFLCFVNKHDLYETTYKYVVNGITEDLSNLFTDYSRSKTKSEVIKIVGVIAAFWMSRNHDNNVEDNVRIFRTTIKALECCYKSNERLALYEHIKYYKIICKYNFPSSLEDVLKVEKAIKVKDTYSEDGEIPIPWKYAVFGYGYILVYHPAHFKETGYPPFRYNDGYARDNFNDVPGIISNLPEIVAVCKEGKIVSLKSVPDLSKTFKLYTSRSRAPKYELLQLRKASSRVSLSAQEARVRVQYYKSPYLKELSNYHIASEKAYFCLEVRMNSNLVPADEEAFIFVISHRNGRYNVVFENCLPDRASIVFTISAYSFHSAIKTIHKYFASDEVNKREALVDGVRFTGSGIISYNHIYHTTIGEWKIKIKCYT